MQAWKIAKFVSEYGAAVAVLIMGSVSIAGTRSWEAAAMVVALAALGLPEIRLACARRIGPWPTMTLLAVLSLACLAAFAWFTYQAGQAPRTVADQRLLLAGQRLNDDVRQERALEFARRKGELLAKAQAMLATGQPEKAAEVLAPYVLASDDKALKSQMMAINVALALAKLQRIDEYPLEEQAEIYELASGAQPSNTALAEKAREVAQRWAEQREAESRVEPGELPDLTAIRAITATRDGSHRGMVAMVRASLRDPSSFEHVSSEYRLTGAEITVHMSYRARGAGEGRVLQAVAKLDRAGKVKTLEQL